MLESQRQEKIRQYLALKPVDHGTIWIEEIHGVPAEYVPHPVIVASMERHGKNLVPVNVLRDGDDFQIVDGHDWVAAARSLGVDRVWANVHDGTTPGIAQEMAQIHAVLGLKSLA